MVSVIIKIESTRTTLTVKIADLGEQACVHIGPKTGTVLLAPVGEDDLWYASRHTRGASTKVTS